MTVAAVVLQIIGVLAAVAAAGLYLDSVWPSVFAAGVVVFALGYGLERR